MTTPLLNIKSLSKHYETTKALDHVSISIDSGKIYGFIGKNGAGKTTLIRTITGLIAPTEGSIEWNGDSSQKALQKGRTQTGVVVEHAGLFPNLSARENLEIQRKLKGVSEKGEIDRVLAIVGLSGTKRKKFKDFSMGMKGRLSIAAALLGSPNFLILDEPTNGLDPVGIMEIRNCLLKLNRKHGITILISSHILGELYSLATDYIMIHDGVVFEQLSLAQLNEKCKSEIILASPNLNKLQLVLKTLSYHDYTISQERLILSANGVDREKLSQALFQNQILLTEFSYGEETLESYFTNAITERNHIQ